MISALIALSILFGIFYLFNGTGLIVICGLAALCCQFEFHRLTRLPHVLLGIVGAAATFVSGIYSLTAALQSFYLSAIFFIGFTIVRVQKSTSLVGLLHEHAFYCFGLFYCGILPVTIARITLEPQGQAWFFCFLSMVFFGDIAAYFSGKIFGSKKLNEIISPKKTVVGALGGFLGSILAATLFSYLWIPQVSASQMTFVAFCVGAVAQLGDLFESLLKRAAQVKDSGTLMPGHGGCLDRIDGVLFAGPVFYFWLKNQG